MAAARKRSVQATLATLVIAVVYFLVVGEWPAISPPGSAPSPSAAPSASVEAPAVRSDDDIVERAFRERRSDAWVELSGVVEKKLSDDRDGSRHQRFILRLASGRTLLVAHNIDLAERVPAARGDAIRLRGEYEWNERGGVVHWTHHDPQGRRAGGWIEHEGRRYR